MSQQRKSLKLKNAGFTLLELMVATLLFVVITGVVFGVLVATQKRYKAEKEYMGAFQQANIAIDQINRDIHGAGFPARILFKSTVTDTRKWAVPVASAADFDLILEEDNDGNGVKWIRYKLTGNTLYRAIAAKSLLGAAATTDAALVPYLENVMNNASASEIAAITTSNPGTFPGGAAVPIFTFPLYQGAAQVVPNIHNINICLIVQAASRDQQTQGVRIATFTAQASTVNPYQ